MSQTRFEYDVFLSHSSKDKPIVRELAERLKADGLRVWLDEWIIKAGDPISLKVQQGIEQSRTLVMCMSPDFFASEWAKLEHHSLLFRDPTNQQRRFIPLLLADCQIPDMIAQFKYIDWRGKSDSQYQELLNSCRANELSVSELPETETKYQQAEKKITEPIQKQNAEIIKVKMPIVLEGHSDVVGAIAVTADGKQIISGSNDSTIRIWDLASGRCLMTLEGYSSAVWAVAVTADGKQIISGSEDNTIRIWDSASGRCLTTLKAHSSAVSVVAVTADGKQIISGSFDTTIRIWDLASGRCLTTLEGHSDAVRVVAVTADGKQIISGSFDTTIRIWDLASGRCLTTLEGHSSSIIAIAVTADGKQIISGSNDSTIRIWDLASGRCLMTLEGHSSAVWAVAVTADGKQIISGSEDNTIRIWDSASGRCLTTLKAHSSAVWAVAVTPNGKQIISGSEDNTIRIWDIPKLEMFSSASKLYTNAKVALIGDSGVGKTGLAIRLVKDEWEITDSTHGMNVWQLPLSDLHTTEIEREVWLWDFAGQPDYRLIHQLFMDETALAVMVIDPQKENPLEPLAHWEKALGIAVKNPPPKLLIAGRCERGGATISQTKLDQYCAEHGYEYFQNTSAKSGDGCDGLKDAIAKFIAWDKLPWTSTSTLFKALKDAIIRIKQEEIALIRFAELQQRLELELKETIKEEDLRAVVGLLGGQGLIKPLDFGDFVLLRPEEINNYASLIVKAARDNTDDIGCVSERSVLAADLPFPDDMKRLKSSDEKFLLLEAVNIFIKRSLCISEDTAKGTQLIFPSYFKQERPEIPDHPNVYVTFQFSGALDEIYSSLVVRLHHTEIFEKKELWRYAADFVTVPTNNKAGFLMTKKTEGEAEIKVYLEQTISDEMQVYFIEFIRKHLLEKAQDVVRIRHYVCSHCGEPLDNQRTQKRIDKGFKDVQCDDCGGTVLLDDVIEKFASEKIRLAINKMDEQADDRKDNDSLDRILVGHATAIVAEAGQIFREVTVMDKGIDGEIEFLDDNGDASGERIYLQLKSGDSYLRHRQRDDKEIFTIKKPRWARYWQSHKYPVMLVIRTSDGRIRWMNVTEYLKKHGADTKQIEFDGEMFTALNVAKMRDKSLK